MNWKYTAGKKMEHPQGLCLLAPRYNKCILSGYSVRDLFLTVIEHYMALSTSTHTPSVWSMQAETVVL